LDIEDPQRRPLHPTDPDARLTGAIDNVRDKPVIIYTSISMWASLMDESLTFPDYPLWDARWGPQSYLNAIRQYQGTTQLHGITADLNVADLDRLGIPTEPPPDAQEELERLRRQLEDMKATAATVATLARSVVDALEQLSER
ncbi:MAG: hypothetical protein ACE5KY_06590, partial [Candidatus Tectimicrobiota bacterium]